MMLFILLLACATCAADVPATGKKIRNQIDAAVVPTTAKRWNFTTGAAVYSSPLVQTNDGGSTGDVIFIGSQDKNVRGSFIQFTARRSAAVHCTCTCSPTVL